MPRVIADAEGANWRVALSGRHTQFSEDEISLEFRREGEGETERRYVRFSPQGAKSPERAYEEASDRLLARLLAAAQPAWTSPDGVYGRGG